MRDYESWIPWENDESAARQYQSLSALETLATRRPMECDSLAVSQDNVLLASKVGRIDKMWTSDPSEGEIEALKTSFARDASLFLDNMFLGSVKNASVKGQSYPENEVFGGTPSDSLYTKSDHRFQVHRGGDLRGLLYGLTAHVKDHSHLSYLEQLNYRPGIIAHPAFRNTIRDYSGNGTFNELPIFYTTAACKTDSPSVYPDGNPLLFTGNVSALMLGIRSGPETMLWVHNDNWAQDVRSNSGSWFLGDGDLESLISERYGTTWIKSRIRRAFGVAEGHRFHCIELV